MILSVGARINNAVGCCCPDHQLLRVVEVVAVVEEVVYLLASNRAIDGKQIIRVALDQKTGCRRGGLYFEDKGILDVAADELPRKYKSDL